MTIFSCPLDARLMIINANPNINYSPNKDTDAREEGHWRYALISGRGEIQQSKTFVVLTLHRLHFLPLSIREAKMHGQ